MKRLVQEDLEIKSCHLQRRQLLSTNTKDKQLLQTQQVLKGLRCSLMTSEMSFFAVIHSNSAIFHNRRVSTMNVSEEMVTVEGNERVHIFPSIRFPGLHHFIYFLYSAMYVVKKRVIPRLVESYTD